MIDERAIQPLDDNFYMDKALNLAQQAAAADEVPVGAVVVRPDGTIIGQGFNQVESCKSQMAHAEMIAIGEATRVVGDWRLDECTLYVTLEPCVMCMGLIQLSRIKMLVYGAVSPLYGHSLQMEPRAILDNPEVSQVYNKGMAIKVGVRAQEAQKVMKRFFQEKRKKKGEYQKTGPRKS